MKYITVSLTILAVMVVLCIFSALYVTKAIDETTQLLESAISAEAAGEHEQVLSNIQQASDTWKSHQVFFGTVLRHDEIDEVMEEFARLISYASTSDQDDLISNCHALIARLDHVKSMEKPSLENIM